MAFALSRRVTLFGHFILDECLPPVLRDSRAFMWLPFRVMFGDKAEIFFRFKEMAPELGREDLRRIYAETADVHIRRETDLNPACVERILDAVAGPRVLDIACGRGYLADRLARRGLAVTGADFVLAEELASRHPSIRFDEADIEALPYADAAFDTVVSAHTLEHVRDFDRAVAELRRVAARKLIVVVPRQRKYRYTFDLHLHFFASAAELAARMGGRGRCEVVGGDLYYEENLKD